MPKKLTSKKSATGTRSRVKKEMAQPRKAQSTRTEFSQAETAPVAFKAPAPSVDWEALIAEIPGGKSLREYGMNREIFTQGQPADSVFYIQKGKVKLSVTSAEGKEAIVATLEAGDFFGEGCLAGQLLRLSTAISMTDCTLRELRNR